MTSEKIAFLSEKNGMFYSLTYLVAQKFFRKPALFGKLD